MMASTATYHVKQEHVTHNIEGEPANPHPCLSRSRRTVAMEMLPERTAARRSVGRSWGISFASLFISSATLLQPTAATYRACIERSATCYCPDKHHSHGGCLNTSAHNPEHIQAGGGSITALSLLKC